MGEWQLDRLAQRQERNATTVSNEQAPVRSADQVFTRPISDADQWQRVEARGIFDPEHQFVVRYRQNGEAKGYQVVTPLRTSFGAVLVDRGFVEMAPGTAIPTTAPAPPSGEVRLTGYVRRNESGRRGAVSPANGQIRLINSDALQEALPYPVSNGYLSALTVDPPQSGGFTPVALPELSNGPHFWYAVQWFMFTAIGVLGIVVFIRADLRDRRRPRAVGTTDEPVSDRTTPVG
jgi:cytochrome oxidase assembly protein ShyY1